MEDTLLLSTAYFPPVEYFSLILRHEFLIIEQEENYHKQTYRNRCRILTSLGTLDLSVPVLKASFHKVKTRDTEIDYSKRWQQIHLRAISSAYRSAPWFQFYFETFEKIISEGHRYLIDLNTCLLEALLEMIGIERRISYTESFVTNCQNDYRYALSPKKESDYQPKKYHQVFDQFGFIPNLSIIDLIFNTGPDAKSYL
ncbi:MAG: WbqC family protein [Bacteroidales bacterium]|nr:WbqC family protein [Bacteroidales bacterium]